MRKINYPLLIGVVIVVVLMLASIYPQYFSQIDPYGRQYERLIYESGKFEGVDPPIPPCKEFPWGTDVFGRDMKTLIIYGCKQTMIMAFVIALGRLLIALPVAIMAAYKRKTASWLIKQFNIMFSAFPLILAVIVIIRWGLFRDLFNSTFIPISVLLILFGWARMASIIGQKVEEVLEQDFIEGEIAIGKNRFEIAIQNIIPHIIPSLIVYYFLEIAMVLIALAQIGVLGAITGGTYANTDKASLEFDWPTLLIYSHYLFGTDKMWIIVYPAFAFALSIIGYNLFGEGLRLEFDRKNSRVISLIKRIPSALSPSVFIYQIRHIGQYKSIVVKKMAVCVLVISIILFPKPQNLYAFNVQGAVNTIQDFEKQQLQAPQSELTERKYAEYIANKLEEYGIKPYDGHYLHEFNINMQKIQVQSSGMVVSNADTSIEPKYKMDYVFMEYAFVDGIFELELTSEEKLGNLNKEEILKMKNKVILVDVRKVKDFSKLDSILKDEICPVAVIYITNETSGNIHEYPASVRQNLNNCNFIVMSSRIGDQLIKMDSGKIAFNVKAKKQLNTGVNVLGYVPGTNEKLKDEYIIIGSPINYLQNNSDINPVSEAGGDAAELEIARDMIKYGIKPEKTIIFAFWGGDIEDGRGSKSFVNKYFSDSAKKVFYIELKDLTSKQSNDILIDTSMVMPKNKIGQNYIKLFKKYADVNDIRLRFGQIASPYAKDFYDKDKQGILLTSSTKGKFFRDSYKNVDEININKFSKVCQMIFNTIVELQLSK